MGVKRYWLSKASLDKVLKELKANKAEIKYNADGCFDFITDFAERRYKANLPPKLREFVKKSDPQSTGKSYRVRISNSSEIAKFVEYGTGRNGVNHPHPTMETDEGMWEYNKGAHSSIDEAHAPIGTWWVDSEKAPNLIPYVSYIGKETGKLYIFTGGQPAQANMYTTIMEVKEGIPILAMQYFKSVGIDLSRRK